MIDFELNDDQKKMLLRIARQTIENTVNREKNPVFSIDDPVLKINCGAFVTIHNKGSLRGCIGNITSEMPLWQTISRMAVEASGRDPRFMPVSAGELKDIDIEISVLSPLSKIKDINEIEVGKHGLLIKKGFYQGLLLPQVATEYSWDRIKFLEQTCYKAGLDRNCYKEKNCEIFIFSAIVFGEKDY